MKPSPSDRLRWRGLGASVAVSALAACFVVMSGGPAGAQPNAPTTATVRSAPASTAIVRPQPAEDGVRWQKLKPAQREALKPLQQEWSAIEPSRKQKWLQLADRMPGMPADERGRIQTRMTDWARMTPAQRGEARLGFQEIKQIPALDRRSRWEAYQALPPEQKRALADRAAAARAGDAGGPGSHRTPSGHGERLARDLPQPKSNIVPNPAFAARPRPIGPTVMQAAPGATTTLITRRPSPPPHQQTGLPKIAATPEFVNKSTLLPQRGAQGAAIRPAPSPEDATGARR